jgi:hypothetical protein
MLAREGLLVRAERRRSPGESQLEKASGRGPTVEDPSMKAWLEKADDEGLDEEGPDEGLVREGWRRRSAMKA